MLETIRFWTDVACYWYYRWAIHDMVKKGSKDQQIIEPLLLIASFEAKYGR